MSAATLHRRLCTAIGTVAALAALAGAASAQSLAPPPLTNLPPVVTAPVNAPPLVVPSVGATIPAMRPPAPDVLPSVEREYRRLRDARLPPSNCNYLGNGRTCAKLWVIDDWRTVSRHKRGKAQRESLRRVPARAAVQRNPRLAIADRDHVPDEVLIEFGGGLSDSQLRALARRHRLTRISIDNISLVGTRIGLFRINDRRSPQAVARAVATDNRVRAAQANFIYTLQNDAAPAAADNAMLYPQARLRLPEAHALARGRGIVVAVIDSGIDIGHPELSGAIADSFDPLGRKETPHQHGTGIAGAIVARAKLTGGAPAAQILAIRAFSESKAGSQSSTSYLILKSLDYAAGHGARIVNMSFAGPRDPLIARGVASAAARGIVMIAAAGNAGPKSPPLYPAALPGVIAVSATSPGDTLFAASNRGPQIALAAPGVDILLPAPGGKYEMMTGTSFSAAFVSGIAALMMERNPTLAPDQVRAILTQTAHDRGPPGRDDLFGAGEADAFAAVSRVERLAVPPVAEPAGEPPAVATAQPAVPGDAIEMPSKVDEKVVAPAQAELPGR
ncbi:S8 family serine peptidase [Rhodopseudomonas palustris]|uniref:S8 family peptidase n=1 Tax=Rhodopseudomonas palustris TaxID=1076 RepID=UPI002ACD6F42|nr:S8 family serine peptidase [Rhodopseudomonas palustris]WQH00089.1 S8 family serine peptidase [Rhodopseudomonas palustris]